MKFSTPQFKGIYNAYLRRFLNQVQALQRARKSSPRTIPSSTESVEPAWTHEPGTKTEWGDARISG
jgi:hypothetical protein